MPIKFIIPEKNNFQNHTLITGFHGIGTTGFITIKYLVNQLSAHKIGTVLSESLPPFITTKEGKISLPFEFFQKEDNTILMPQFQPYRQEHRIFAEKLVNWTKKAKFQQAILVGGLDSRLRKEETDKVRVVATTKYLNDYEEELPILEEGLFVTGPLALMLTFYEINDFPAIALLPYAESSRPDPLAASIAVEMINSITNLDVDTTNLIKDAETIEQNLQEIVSQTKEQGLDEKIQGSKRLYI